MPDLDHLLPRIAAGDPDAFGQWVAGVEVRLRLSLSSFAAELDLEPVVPLKRPVAGIAMGMSYTGEASITDLVILAGTLEDRFLYENAVSRYRSGAMDLGWARLDMINPNLDAGYPVLLGFYASETTETGHAVVCDGYGYNNGTLYHHINMGWDGDDRGPFRELQRERRPRISVFGLGYVGCVSAACLARDGHEVVGVDTNDEKVALLNQARSPIIEPGVDAIISEAVTSGRLRATNSASEATPSALASRKQASETYACAIQRPSGLQVNADATS